MDRERGTAGRRDCDRVLRLERPVVSEPAQVVRAGLAVRARERDRPVAGLTRLPTLTLVDAVPVVRGDDLRDLRVDRSVARDPRRRRLRLEDVPRGTDLREAVALLVRLVPVEIPGRGVERL